MAAAAHPPTPARLIAPTLRFALAPAPAPRPLQVRRTFRLLRELLENPDETTKVFELFEAIGGRGDERTLQAVVSHAEGRSLFLEKPALLPLLADRKGLAALPAGSLGRAYLAFAQQNGFAADGLLAANETGLGEVNAGLDPARRWFYERVNLIHDLWHVLTGYGTDPAGETALLAFSFAQGLRSRAIRMLLVATTLHAPLRQGLAFRRFLWQARSRGHAARPLFVQRYEDLLPQPLAEVRNALGIAPLRDAHPGGVFRIGADPSRVERVAV